MGPIQSSRTGGKRAPMAEINVTPLVDVMLVLLIIFMVTAPLLVAGVPINLPDSRAKSLDQSDKPVQVSMDATGAIFIDDQEVSRADLAKQLAGIGALGADAPQIYLRADRGLDYGEVMAVMGEINRAGLTRVALVTTEASKSTDR